ncbi:hypothetical protein V6N13_062670 [Hibiscus sabdariffa]|uniref:Amine oxidase domain-containing protein n=1 Tax=Hibiscus sabdariffa TaxID=183260 RepID=A0ABR2BB41_9ROSI
MGGDHCFLHGGNGRLVQALADNVPILYDKTVHAIRYGNDGVQVMAGNQMFEGDMAHCNVIFRVDSEEAWFGSFSVIFGQKIADPKSPAILRITCNEPRKKNQEGSKTDQQHSNKALELREVRGGDEMRLNYLCKNLGIKLVGRKGLEPAADSLIASIKAQRVLGWIYWSFPIEDIPATFCITNLTESLLCNFGNEACDHSLAMVMNCLIFMKPVPVTLKPLSRILAA